MIETELGHIQIFFGKVLNNSDPESSLRCQVAIPGKTDKIEKDKLPWYYSWNGVGQLPELNDEVPVIIFDGNFATGFYGKTLVSGPVQAGANYQDYVQIFKKFSDDSDASITYELSSGIVIRNGSSSLNLSKAINQLFCGSNGIEITSSSITLGKGNMEAALLGNKTVALLEETYDFLEKLITSIYDGFNRIQIGSAPGAPFTAGITTQMTQFNVLQPALSFGTKLKLLKTKLKFIQSNNFYHD